MWTAQITLIQCFTATFPQTQLTMEDIQRFSATRIALDRREQSTSPESRLYRYLPSASIFKTFVFAKRFLVYIPYDSKKSTKIFYFNGINRLAFLVEAYSMFCKARSELRNVLAMTFTINPQKQRSIKTNISAVNLSKKAESLL